MGTNLISLLTKLVLPVKLHISGGGGDGGAQAEADRVRAEESQTEYQIAQDKAKINALFGITDYDYADMPDELLVYDGGLTDYQSVQDDVTRLESLIAGAEADPEYAGAFGYEKRDAFGSGDDAGVTQGAPDWYEQLAAAQKKLEPFSAYTDYDPDALASQAEEAFGTRESTLTGIYDDILGKYDYEQGRQYDRKSSDISAMLAGRGLSRSTVGQSVFDRLDELRDTNTVSFEEGASDAVSRIRASDTDTLQNLISQIDAGGDYSNARTTALSDLTTNIDTSVSAANARDLTDLFKGMDELYGQTQYVDAYNQGQTYGSSNIVTPGSSSSYSGTLV